MSTTSIAAPESVSAEPTRRQVAAYGVGAASANLTDHALTHLASPIFTILLGVSPVLVGALLTITRIWDAFSEPLMGAISDNFRSRWGRRRPFILAGGVVAGLAFIGLYWFPRGWEPSAYFAYLTVFSLIFYTAHTVFNVPYLSLLAELSPSTAGRNRLVAAATMCMRGVSVLVIWLYSITQLPIFTDTIQGVRATTLFLGVLAMGFAIWTFLGVREPHQDRVQHQEKFPLMAGIKETFRLKAIYPLLAADILIGIAGNIVNTLGFFILVYHVRKGDMLMAGIDNGVLGTAFLASSVLAVAPMTRFMIRFGRRNAFYVCVAAIIAGSLLKLVCYREGDGRFLAVPFLLIGPGVCIATMILTAMKADIVDMDELKSGKRREGMIGAVQSWVSKTVNSLNFFLAGLLLAVSGFEVSLGMEQSPGTFKILLILFSVVPIGFALLAVVAIRRFPIDEAAAAQLRRTLEARRGE